MANGAEQTRVDKAPERRSPLSTEELMAIEDEAILDKMVWPDLVAGVWQGQGPAGTRWAMTGICLQLDQTTDFQERKLIRAALRDLRQRKRGR